MYPSKLVYVSNSNWIGGGGSHALSPLALSIFLYLNPNPNPLFFAQKLDMSGLRLNFLTIFNNLCFSLGLAIIFQWQLMASYN